MSQLRSVKVTIGGPEVTAGTAVAREYVVPIAGKPDLRQRAEKLEDPVIIGAGMSRGQFLVAKNSMGGIPLSPRCCGGFGQSLNSLMGQESAPTQIGAIIRVRYTGSDASCKITANTSADTLTSVTGALGSESADSNFGTGGSYDLTAGASDTVAELVTAISGDTDYECELVTGDNTTDAADIVDIEYQAKNRWVYILFSAAASGIYAHRWTPVLTSGTERPTYSVQVDGMHDNFLYDGAVVDKMSLSGALKALIEGSMDILAMSEATGQSVSALTLESVNPLIFGNGSVSVGGTDFTYVRNFSMDIMNGHRADGYGTGSTERQYQSRGDFGVSGRVKIRHDSDAYALRTSVFDDSTVGLHMHFYSNVDLATNYKALMVVNLPYCQLGDYEFPEEQGIVDTELPWMASNPDSYSDPVEIILLTDDSGAY